MSDTASKYAARACPMCADAMTETKPGRYNCPRCGTKESSREALSPNVTLAFALSAFCFYVPAMMFPFMTVELYGNVSKSTIWGGILSLTESGSYGIAIVVFLASILIPLLKIIILLFLGLAAGRSEHRRFQTQLYRMVEAIGRWSMLDIFLLAILVAMLKPGHWTSVKAEVGSTLFLLVVIFTMLASACFDPKLIWNTHAPSDPKLLK